MEIVSVPRAIAAMAEALIPGAALAASAGPALEAADAPAGKITFRSIQEALAQAAGGLLRVRRQNGPVRSGRPGHPSGREH